MACRSAGLFAAALAVWGCGSDRRADSSRDAVGGSVPGDAATLAERRPAVDESTRSWDECGTLPLPATPGSPGEAVIGIAISPDRTWMVETTGHHARAWRVSEPFAESTPAWTVGGLYVFPSFSPDGAFVAVSGDGREVFDAATGERVYAPDEPLPAPGVPNFEKPCWLWFLGFSSRAEWVAGGNCEKGVQVFSMARRTLAATLPSGSANVGAAFSADDTLVATGVPELYRTSDWTRVWAQPLREAPPAAAGLSITLNDVTFTPDGKELIATACWSGLRDFRCETSVHSVRTGARLGALPLSGPRPSFSPSGAWLVSGGDAFHRASGKLMHLGTFASATFASNGDIFAGTSDGVLKRLCVHEDAP